MPFCAQCGAQVEGKFCQSCGALADPASIAGGPAAPSAAGVPENVAGALCYLLGFVTGVIFLAIPPYNQNPRVRFHAFQSIFFHLGWIGLTMALGIVAKSLRFLAILFLPIPVLLGIGGFFLWLFLMWRAYQNRPFVLPFIGPFAQEQANNVRN